MPRAAFILVRCRNHAQFAILSKLNFCLQSATPGAYTGTIERICMEGAQFLVGTLKSSSTVPGNDHGIDQAMSGEALLAF